MDYEDELPQAARNETMDETTNKTLAEQIEDRKQQAEDRQIAKKAALVAREFGSKHEGGWMYVETGIRVEYALLFPMAWLKIATTAGLVFNQCMIFAPAPTPVERRIESYIPGPWEETLDTLHARALVRKAEREADEERVLRAQWGL